MFLSAKQSGLPVTYSLFSQHEASENFIIAMQLLTHK